jgi:LmbE family N-acetylglucosaminyl deacetylase
MPENPEPSVLVISPHLDDAVLSCAEAITVAARDAAVTVLTVFAGTPDDGGMQTDWDSRSGFSSAREAMAARRAEDAAALAILGAAPCWLDFLDSQYGAPAPADAIAAELERVARQRLPRTILFPAGLFHSDHVLAHQAALLLRRRLSASEFLMYEEAHYRRLPGFLQRRLAQLLADGIEATPLSGRGAAHAGEHEEARKEAALACYASQLRALAAKVRDGHADAFAPERFWALRDLPAAGAR